MSLLLLRAASSVAAAPQLVVPLEGEPFAAELVAIDDSGRAVFRTMGAEGVEGEQRIISLDELVRWGHPVQPRPQIIVVLADGGRLVAAAEWAGGAPVRLERDTVMVSSGILDDVRLPRELVQGLVFVQRSHPEEREQLAEQVLRGTASDPSPGLLLEETGSSDAVLLTNGDRLDGRLAELGGGSLTLVTRAGDARPPLSRIKALNLDSRGRPAKTERPQFAIGLRDGSLLYGDNLRADEIQLTLQGLGEVRLKGGTVADVISLQALGGRFTYLSDLEPNAYRHVPYLAIEWPYQRDRNVLGGPLTGGGKRYLKGIGMHSASRVTYALDGKYQRLDASLAIDDSAEGRGSVMFAVYLLREGQWQKAFTSGIIRGGDVPQCISVDVTGATGLTLTIDYADRGDELDRANWLDARLIHGRN